MGNITGSIWNRAKNYGNIRFSEANDWKGQIGQISGFVKFDSFVNGVRAIFLILQSYNNRKINTIQSVIKTYAPSSDGNDTDLYTASVSKWSGIAKDKIFAPQSSEGVKVVKAIIQMETGEKVSENILAEAFTLAFDGKNSNEGSVNTNSEGVKKKIIERLKEKKIVVALVLVLIVVIIAIRK